jgi:hypothetical protein
MMLVVQGAKERVIVQPPAGARAELAELPIPFRARPEVTLPEDRERRVEGARLQRTHHAKVDRPAVPHPGQLLPIVCLERLLSSPLGEFRHVAGSEEHRIDRHGAQR